MRVLHSVHHGNPAKYNDRPLFAADGLLPTPLAVMVQTLGFLHPSLLPQDKFFLPDVVGEDSLDNQMAPPGFDYEMYAHHTIPNLRHIGIDFCMVDNSADSLAGSYWLTLEAIKDEDSPNYVLRERVPHVLYQHADVLVRALLLSTDARPANGGGADAIDTDTQEEQQTDALLLDYSVIDCRYGVFAQYLKPSIAVASFCALAGTEI
ncbi:hypothetical protein YB2330_005217 [Saitoella coloradoensis]